MRALYVGPTCQLVYDIQVRSRFVAITSKRGQSLPRRGGGKISPSLDTRELLDDW
jgi:hypothetical protein